MQPQTPRSGSASQSRTNAGFLWPREHGATVQALLPPLTGLLAGACTPAALLLTAALWLALLAHEPLLVLAGQRGQGVRRRCSPAARRQLALVVPLAAAAGGAGLWLAPTAARWAALAASCVAGVHAVRLAQGRALRAVGSELFAAVGLSLAALPVLLAARLPAAVAGWHAASWAVGFALLTAAVHASKARGALAAAADRPATAVNPDRGTQAGLAWPRLTALAAGAVAVAALVLPGGRALALLAGAAALTASVAVRPKQIRLLGVGFALTSAAASVLLAAG